MPDQDALLDDYRQRIDQTVGQLQSQTDVPLWVVANSDAIKAAALDEPFTFGPRGRVVRRIFAIVGKGLASLIVLWIIGFVVVAWRWFHAVLSKRVPVEGVFVGIGAGSEEQLFSRFKAELGGRAIRVSHDKPRTFGVSKPPLGSLLKHLWNESRRVHTGLRLSDHPAIARGFCMWMTVSAMRVGTYTFVKAWAEQLPLQVKRVVFIAADVQCFAAVDGRRRDQQYTIEYWQHGLHYLSLVIPSVDRILALNYPEGRHMHRLSESPFELLYENEFPISDKRTATLLFASIYTAASFDKKNHIALLHRLFAWAEYNTLCVVIRPHPREDKSFWSEHFPALQLDPDTNSFSACVERWRPSLVVSWFSTALLDALRLGVAPVLLTEGSAPFLRDMAFPLDRIALRWPEESEKIETIIRDQDVYRHWVSRRWEQVFTRDGEQVIAGNRDHVGFEGLTQ